MRAKCLPMILNHQTTMYAPENRAAVPNPNAPSRLPPTIVLPATATGPERKSGTLQGPSAKQWAQHRDKIISLYRKHPLKRVSEIMRREYGFSASKRMYDKRFREWNVFKNVNSDEKDRLVRIANFSDKDSRMGQAELRKTVQVTRKITQGLRRSPVVDTLLGPSSAQAVTSYRHPAQQSQGALTTLNQLKEQDSTLLGLGILKTEASSPHSQFSSPELVCTTPVSDMSSSDDHLSIPSAARSASNSPAPSLGAYQLQIQTLAGSPPPPMTPDSKTRILDIITLSIRDYYDWQLQNIPEGVLPDDYLGLRVSEESTQYWGDIKNAIYMIKISVGSTEELEHRPDRRAWPVFARAGTLAASAMINQPFDFLRNVLATLSPANTSARPELRSILLKFLATEARNNLSPNHPITLICQELQKDEGCQEISRRALQCMLDVFNSRLGRSRAVTFKLLDSLATLLRRNGEFEAAMEIITELLNSCRQVFGHDSDQARAVENELAHFYMMTDECDRALDHCMAVVKRPQAPGIPVEAEPVFYQDSIAAHTMEDIAEIHQRQGDVERCITWLERAAAIALNIWGPKAIATGHIVDKVTSLQRQFGKDLLRSAMRWEAALV
ncbi:hypothetical protein B0T26DRAFT_705930 [Lasiosphaeria miniovina]|uniref:Clr5 domain-containing protein n=1 Tax=Lasiosphaeria miniovina TaxID=1954250 RepID=A0AA40AWH0_9PEZI|nr:uncharacterized protein B0T26DRAFT_705930 [Lasiosphaeria miniovina]KAK0723263.1 hypothetical protein B0T26DRAFT_705930 [Lasiosphaeria miniovina]